MPDQGQENACCDNRQIRVHEHATNQPRQAGLIIQDRKSTEHMPQEQQTTRKYYMAQVSRSSTKEYLSMELPPYSIASSRLYSSRG
jgi:hypothetical protein